MPNKQPDTGLSLLSPHNPADWPEIAHLVIACVKRHGRCPTSERFDLVAVCGGGLLISGYLTPMLDVDVFCNDRLVCSVFTSLDGEFQVRLDEPEHCGDMLRVLLRCAEQPLHSTLYEHRKV